MDPPSGSASQATRLLQAWQGGDVAARDQLVTVIYDDLRRIASRQLQSSAPMTLQPTALVHEAWLKLSKVDQHNWQSRAHFMSLASRVMRQIAIDHARRKAAAKRPGGIRVTLNEELLAGKGMDLDVLALDAAMEALAALDDGKARIIEMHYFGGMSSEEIAEVMGCSAITVKRGWRTARAWLRQQLEAPV